MSIYVDGIGYVMLILLLWWGLQSGGGHPTEKKGFHSIHKRSACHARKSLPGPKVDLAPLRTTDAVGTAGLALVGTTIAKL